CPEGRFGGIGLATTASCSAIAEAIDSPALFARLERNIQTIAATAITAAATVIHFTIGRERSLTHAEVAIYCSINGSRFNFCAEARPLANVVLLIVRKLGHGGRDQNSCEAQKLSSKRPGKNSEARFWPLVISRWLLVESTRRQ